MNIEEQVKVNLTLRGFAKETQLNNRGLIGATIDETVLEVFRNIEIKSPQKTDQKTEKIYRPSQLKDGDRVNFSIAYLTGEVAHYPDFTVKLLDGDLSLHKQNLSYFGLIMRKKDLFVNTIQHVERIIESNEYAQENPIVLRLLRGDKATYYGGEIISCAEEADRILIKYKDRDVKMDCVSVLMKEYISDYKIKFLDDKEELHPTDAEQDKYTKAANQPSNRIEKYDLFSRESIETVDEVKSLLEKIVDLVEKLKKLGIKIKI